MIDVLIWVLAGYVILHSVVQAVISFLTWSLTRKGMARSRAQVREFMLTGLEPPVTVIIPGYNEEATIVTSVRSMLQLRYSEFEVMVVNDGSKDATLQALIDAFQLEPFPASFAARLPTRTVRAVYRSANYPNLKVVDKENGGKADAINTGINAAQYPLFCCLDADSILDRDALLHVAQPFIEDSRTVAVGGTVRLANGCVVREGNLLKAGVPASWLARFQIVEYLRAFLFGRMGWSRLNGLLIISGAFGLMHKDTVVEAGGYRHATIGEDMELIVRMHRMLKAQRRPYRISYVPEPVCWTEAPEDWKTLRNQRVRWYRGLCESLWFNKGMLFNWPPEPAGWLAYPYFLLFEWGAPIVEVLGYLLLAYMLVFTGIRVDTALLFLLAALGFGILLSALALTLEEASFHVYPRQRDMLVLLAFSVLENFGYRQVNVKWRLQGLWLWIQGKQGGWGDMQRKGIGAPAAKPPPQSTSGSSK